MEGLQMLIIAMEVSMMILIPIAILILVILIYRNTSRTRKMTRRILQKMNGVQPTPKEIEEDVVEGTDKESGDT